RWPSSPPKAEYCGQSGWPYGTVGVHPETIGCALPRWQRPVGHSIRKDGGVMRAFKFRFGLSMCMCMCVILSMQPVRAGIPALDELGRTIPGLIDPALGGFAVADFDGDESEDVLVPSSNGSAMFVVFGRTGDDIGIKQSVVFPDGYYTRAIV